MVVDDGLTLVDPLAEVEVNVPGAIETLVASEVTQLRVLLTPELMLVGLAENELITGAVCCWREGEFEEDPPQPINPAHANTAIQSPS